MSENVTIRSPQIDAAGILFYPRCFELLAMCYPESPLDRAPVTMQTRFLRPLRLGDKITIALSESGVRWSFSAQRGLDECFRVESIDDLPKECGGGRGPGQVTQDGILGSWACGPTGRMQLSRSFEYLNVAVEETLEQVLGMPFAEMHVTRGIGIPTVQFTTQVNELPTEGQRVSMETNVQSVGRTSLTLRHRLRRADTLLVENVQTVVFVEMLEHDYRSVPIPDDMRAPLEASIDVAA